MTLSTILSIRHKPNRKEMSTFNYRRRTIIWINKMQLVARCGHQKLRHKYLNRIIMQQMIWMISMNSRKWVINLCLLSRTTMILKCRANKGKKMSRISKDDRCNNKKKYNSKKPDSKELRSSQLKLISSKFLKLAQPMKVPINNNSNCMNKLQVK